MPRFSPTPRTHLLAIGGPSAFCWPSVLGVLLISFWPILASLFLMVFLGGCQPSSPGRVKLMVWGLASTEETKGLDATVAAFEARNPDVDVVLLSMGAGGMNPQKLMTSIAGDVPPDVIDQDRFTIGDWASRGAFRPLDDLIEQAGINPDDFYPACWNEAVYEGRVYAIPYGTDDRALYWNKALFREVGLDPERPPQTWEELLDDAVKLTAYRPDGSFERIGFIPNYGNSWLYLYSWQNGGEFMSPDGRTCTLDNPYTIGALEWMVEVYDALKGAEAIGAFQSTFQTEALDPFYTGKVAMKIDGNWVLNLIARYAPDLDFGVAPAPVPAARLRGEGRFKGQPPFITWSGGFSLAIPRGARHVEEAWRFIQWMTSLEGWLVLNEAQRAYNFSQGRPYVPNMSANRKVDEEIFRRFAPEQPRLRKGLRTFMDLMPVSRFRPVTFVGQRLWDEHVRAFEQAIHHKMTPAEALAAGRKTVQEEYDKIRQQEQYPRLAWWKPLSLVALLLAGLLTAVGLALRRAAVGKLLRSEAWAGWLFASPWLVGFLIFTAGPLIASIIFSFCHYDVLHPARYVGLKNYRDLVADPLVWKTIYNVGFLSILGIPLGMAAGLAIAMLLNAKVRGMSWYRTGFYLPSIVPAVANAILWIWILQPDFGLVNAGYRTTIGAHVAPFVQETVAAAETWMAHQAEALPAWLAWLRGPLQNPWWLHWLVEAPKWLASESWSKPALILMGLWGAGAGMIIWLAGLQGIPQHLYEAAQLDGASAWQQFRHVTLPMLTPYIFFNLIIGTIGSLQRFVDVYIMTNGGPVDSTQVPVLYLFRNAFQYFKMGYASSMAWFLFVIILALTLIQLKVAPRWVHYEGGPA